MKQRFQGCLSGKNVLLLQGGPGEERTVSLRSGEAVAKALQEAGAKVTPLDVRDDGFEIPHATELVFNVIHGTFGEDGQLQALLDDRGIAYTGEGARGSRQAFDKILTKEAFETHSVPTPVWERLGPDDLPRMPLPFVLKAPRQGSSVGVHLIRDSSAVASALADCRRFGDEVLVEAFFTGRELTVGILGDEALPVVEIVPEDGFYDYEHKYTKGASRYFIPAPLDPSVALSVQEAALAAHRALNLEVYSRVDVLLAPSGGLAVLEINTIPGMTELSLLPKAAAAAGLAFPALCEEIAGLSLLKK
jgi:D-alanine-D-alanine ligase